MSLRLLILRQLGGIGRSLVLVDIHPSDGGAGLGDLDDGRLLEVRRSLNGLNKVRHKIGTALVDVLNLSPGGVDGLGTADQAVVTADGGKDDENENAEDDEECFIHGMTGGY